MTPPVEHDRLCPTCQHEHETPEHLLKCDTPSRRKIRHKYHLSHLKLCTKYAIDPHLTQMWWLGMTSTHPEDHEIDFYPPEYHPIFLSQQSIGWKQIYYGRISKQWTHHLMTNHPEIDPNQVWTYVLEIWTDRNNDQAILTNRFPANMLTDLQGIYAARNRLPPHTHDRIYNHTHDELLLKPKPYIQNWIQNNKTYIQKTKNPRQTNQNRHTRHTSVFSTPLTTQSP